MVSSVAAQSQDTDSLKRELNHAKSPQVKIDLLCSLAYSLFIKADDSPAFAYAKQAKAEAESVHYPAGLKFALTLSGFGYVSQGDYQKAMVDLQRSKIIHLNGKPTLVSFNLMVIGDIYRDLASYDSAKHYYTKAIQVLGEKDDPNLLGVLYRCLAQIDILLWKNDEALNYLKKAESLGNLNPSGTLLPRIWFLYSMLLRNMGDYSKAQFYASKLCNQSNASSYDLQVRCNISMSQLLLKQGLFVNALKYAFQALEITSIYKFPADRVLVYSTIGECYAELSQFSMAFKYYFEGLKISERAGLRYQMAESYTELAWIYKDQFNYEMALDYLDKSDKLNLAIGNVHGTAKNHNIRGLILLLQRKFNAALDEYEKAFLIRQTIADQIGISAIIYNKSLVYEALSDLENSLKLQFQALEVEERVNNKQGLGLSYNSIAALMIKMKQLTKAEEYLNKAWALSLETQSKTLQRSTASNYSLLYEARGDLTNALKFNKKFVELNDSIYSENSTTKLAEMQALYQVEKKEQEINRLTDQRKTQEKELDTQRSLAQQQQFIIIISLIAILLMLIAGFIAYRYILEKSRANSALKKLNLAIIEQKEEIQAQSEELMEASETISNINKDLESRIEASTSKLKQAYKELDTFFYRSSHDFRRPITTFLGLAGVAKITVKDPVSLELFDKVSETATGLDKMLRKLQSISDLGSQQMIYKDVSVRELVQEVLDGLGDLIRKQGIIVQMEIDENLSFISYPALVKIIIENLIENAIHFAGFEKPFVRVRFSVDNQIARLVVTDNGQGIFEEYQNRIFDMYYRANDRSKGNGLGLYISKKAIEKLEGRIYFTSLQGEGSTFTAEFPNTHV